MAEEKVKNEKENEIKIDNKSNERKIKMDEIEDVAFSARNLSKVEAYYVGLVEKQKEAQNKDGIEK